MYTLFPVTAPIRSVVGAAVVHLHERRDRLFTAHALRIEEVGHPELAAHSSRSGLMSTPMIWFAPASRAPWITFNPMPPSPKTTTLSPTWTLAVLITAPTPVVPPQPM